MKVYFVYHSPKDDRLLCYLRIYIFYESPTLGMVKPITRDMLNVVNVIHESECNTVAKTNKCISHATQIN